jgi:3-dehydroquinate dehydratase-2
MLLNIVIINGPNLNLLGIREKNIYGSEKFEMFFNVLQKKYKQIKFIYHQTNIEGEIIDLLHQYGFNKKVQAIILNPGGYSHTSVAIADAIAAIEKPVIEVHISNIHAREEYRHHSITAKHCKGIIAGFGLNSYTLAVQSVLNQSSQ